MNGWSIEPLGKHAEIRARIGWRGLSSDEYRRDGPFLIAGQHIKEGRVQWGSCDHISDDRYDESPEIALRDHDVIISKDGTIGRVARIDSLPGPATLNGTMMLVRPRSTLDYRFLYHLLQADAFKKLIADKVSGSSIPHIFQRDMVALGIAIPAIAEQTQIAVALDLLDREVAWTVTLIDKLKQIRAGLLHDLLTCGLDENGERRDPLAHPEQFWNSSLGLMPKNWEVRTLEQLLARVPHPLRSGPFGSALLKRELKPTGIPLLGIDNVHVERFDNNFSRFVDDQKFAELIRYAVRSSDLMITVMGTVGRCCVVPAEIGKALSSKHVWTISMDLERYSPSLACWQINHAPWIIRQLRRDEQGGVMTAIRSETLRRLFFPVPGPDELHAIETVLHHSAETIAREESELNKLYLLKSGLMSDLLTGRVRVPPDLLEVPA